MDLKVISDDLMQNVVVLAEPIQMLLRKNGIANSYDKLKSLTRGKSISMKDFSDFIDSLDIVDSDRIKLKSLLVTSYTGCASKLASIV